MQLLDRFRRLLRILRALAKYIRVAAQQLLLPVGDLVGMQVEFLYQLGHGQRTLDRRQRDLGLESR